MDTNKKTCEQLERYYEKYIGVLSIFFVLYMTIVQLLLVYIITDLRILFPSIFVVIYLSKISASYYLPFYERKVGLDLKRKKQEAIDVISHDPSIIGIAEPSGEKVEKKID